jgi:SAM-dependent methyltransferase
VRQAQIIEIDKYREAYKNHGYRMGAKRARAMREDLAQIPRGSLLDVGCGRGELLTYAESIGFEPVKGVEVVDQLIDKDRVVYGLTWDLPFEDKEFDVVCMMDVMEHLLPMDALPTCLELERVAIRTILMSIASGPDVRDGVELHIHQQPPQWWDAFLKTIFDGDVRIVSSTPVSTTWRIDLEA